MSLVSEDPVQEVPTKPVAQPPSRILAIDIGGTKLKILAQGQTEPRKAPSGRRLTPLRMVETVKELAADWEFDAVSLGFPGLVGDQGPRSEPGNLGSGWVGFDYASAFGVPVRVSNDAAMQALGSYEGGRMLFLGLGTGLGSTLIVQNIIIPLELGRLIAPSGAELGMLLGRRGLRAVGKKAWREAVGFIIPALMAAFTADYVVLGGGNSKEIKALPPGTRLGHNLTAFRGGFRLWHMDDIPTLDVGAIPATWALGDWRML